MNFSVCHKQQGSMKLNCKISAPNIICKHQTAASLQGLTSDPAGVHPKNIISQSQEQLSSSQDKYRGKWLSIHWLTYNNNNQTTSYLHFVTSISSLASGCLYNDNTITSEITPPISYNDVWSGLYIKVQQMTAQKSFFKIMTLITPNYWTLDFY